MARRLLLPPLAGVMAQASTHPTRRRHQTSPSSCLLGELIHSPTSSKCDLRPRDLTTYRAGAAVSEVHRPLSTSHERQRVLQQTKRGDMLYNENCGPPPQSAHRLVDMIPIAGPVEWTSGRSTDAQTSCVPDTHRNYHWGARG
ncbi:hypothetical protein B0H66DRAFT_586322 [Apodospora peruviana]|uniref:Uncharacterized protein n=1 Tax=Apodospora peruviana TaxID=516989 RepID=A0AAE0IRQ0_9PEZI|nr:hypothetical protein B0H66DRAFT_586322 [Apodospora peruviana]